MFGIILLLMLFVLQYNLLSPIRQWYAPTRTLQCILLLMCYSYNVPYHVPVSSKPPIAPHHHFCGCSQGDKGSSEGARGVEGISYVLLPHPSLGLIVFFPSSHAVIVVVVIDWSVLWLCLCLWQ